ncbi:MAG: LarC family nickel insertion protein [Candidatus Thermoplasmatota archaeon]|nr:LarC family nickel insertion protein [Candidatus Thermoplasmatota archaeon]
MIHIDAREGVSADMLLAAMIDLLPETVKEDAIRKLVSAAEGKGLSMQIIDIEDSGDRGIGISYVQRVQTEGTTEYRDAYRCIDEITTLLGSGRESSNAILDKVFEAEAAAHGVSPEEVHLHEIGRPQAMMNMAGIGFIATLLEKDSHGEFVSSTLTTGRGIVVTGHGTFRLPAPATAHLLKALRHVPGDCPGERATPTGVAAISALISEQTDDVPDDPLRKSVGFGTKRFAGRLGRTTLRLV